MKETLEGVDVTIEISLQEYGIAWVERENEYHFIYGIKSNDHGDFTHFDWADIDKSIDFKPNYNWVDWDCIYSYVGMTAADWHSQPIPLKIYDLLNYYGYENVFGTSYTEGIPYLKLDYENKPAPDYLEYQIPDWALSAIVNDDYSGLSEADEKLLNQFLSDLPFDGQGTWEFSKNKSFIVNPDFGLSCDGYAATYYDLRDKEE